MPLVYSEPLTRKTSEYLRILFDLGEDGIVATPARIFERVDVSRQTAKHTIERLVSDGVATMDSNRRIDLTAAGWRSAAAMVRKQRIVESFLDRIIGMEPVAAHNESIRVGYILGAEAERRMFTLAGSPTLCPWRNPIPCLHPMGAEQPAPPTIGSIPATAVLLSEHKIITGTVNNLSECALSDPRILTRLMCAGILPSARVRVDATAKVVDISGPGGKNVQVTRTVAASIHLREIVC